MPDKNTKANHSLKSYFRLLAYVKPMWPWFLLSVFGHALFASTQAGYAHLMKYFVEALQGGADALVYLVPAGAVGIAVLRAVGAFIGSYFMAKVGERLVHQLRCEMFGKMVELPCDFFDQNNSGSLLSRIVYNVSMVTKSATGAITVVVREGLTVVVLLGYLLWSHWQLTVIFALIAPVIALVVTSAGKRLKQLSHNVQDSVAEVTHVTSEAITGYRVMRSYGGEEYERNRFAQASKDNLRQGMKIQRTSAIVTPVIQLLVIMSMALIMWMVLLMRNEADVATLIAYVTAAGLLPKPLRQLSEVYGNIQQGLAAAERIFEHLDLHVEADQGQRRTARAEGKIEIKSLSFTYNNSEGRVLKNLCLTINPGESVALVGKSGSGKSTLSNLIPRFYEYQDGDICLDGYSIRDYELSNLREQIALVTQQVTLFHDTVEKNIAYGKLSDRSREEIEIAAKMAFATEFIEKLPEGFDTMIGENGIRLSGGQRQRLSIARAILKDAPILILDEATSALDVESELYIQKAMDVLMRDRTTIVIAHRLSTIRNVDKIAVIEEGEIVEIGTHEELLLKGDYYYRLYNSQFSGEDEV